MVSVSMNILNLSGLPGPSGQSGLPGLKGTYDEHPTNRMLTVLNT